MNGLDMSNMQQMFNSLAREVEKKSEELADTIFNAPEAEVMVKTATNNDQWGPSGTEMMKIADLTHRYNELRTVMDTLWARITERREGKNWRNVYKGLLLLDYLLKNGSDKVVSETRSRIYELKQLTRFNYIDSGGVDRGLSIRERTKQIIDLAHDTDRLKEERKNAKKNRGKFAASIGSDSGGAGHYASQDHFRRTDPHYGREPSRRSPRYDDSDEEKPRHYGGHHGTTRKSSNSKKKSDLFDSDSDSEARAATTEVPKKEAWEPFPSAKKGQAPVKPATPAFDDDDDWGDFTATPAAAAPAPLYQTPIAAAPTNTGFGNFTSMRNILTALTSVAPSLTPTSNVAPAATTPAHHDLLGTSLLSPTPVGGQTSFLESTKPVSFNIDKDDPWAAGAHLFSLSAVNSSTSTSNNKPFGATGSTFTTGAPPPSTFGSASGIPSTTTPATGVYGYPATATPGFGAGYPVPTGAAVAPGYGAPGYGVAGAYPGYTAAPAGYGQPGAAGYNYTAPTGF